MRKEPARYLVISALLAVQVLFGFGYSTSKILVEAFPPLVWAGFRVLLSAGLMFAVASAARRPAPTLNRSYLSSIFVFSLLGVALNQSAFLVGLRYTSATNSAILNTLIPVFTILIVTVRGLEPFSRSKGLGCLCALGGVLLLRHAENFSLSNNTLIGDMLTVFHCACYALFLSYSKPFFTKNDPFWATAWIFLSGGLVISVMATPQLLSLTLPEMTPTLWACVAYSVLGTTLLSYFLNSWALAYARSTHVALFGYVQPVVAALVAWAWQNEEISARTALSCSLIFAGLALGLQRGALRIRLPGGRSSRVEIVGESFQLNDISSSGFSIVLTKQEGSPFREGESYQLRMEPFSGVLIEGKAEAVTVIALERDGWKVRVGFQFESIPVALAARISREVVFSTPRSWLRGIFRTG